MIGDWIRHPTKPIAPTISASAERLNGRWQYRIGEELLPQRLTVQEVTGLARRAEFEGGIYPPTALRRGLLRLNNRYCAKQVGEVGGLGCFLNLNRAMIKAGDLVGVYTGRLSVDEGSYAMKLTEQWNVDGTPQGDDSAYIMSRINDWIWDDTKQNCKITQGGVIIASKHIHPGQQLCMTYSEGYNWDHVKVYTLHAIPGAIDDAATQLNLDGFDGHIDLIRRVCLQADAAWRALLQAQPWGELITMLIDGELREDYHRIEPIRLRD
jgi:hypothetical protein